MSQVQELNDSCFALATELVAELSREFECELGEKPTLAELLELIAWGIRSCSGDILADIDPSSLLSLTPKVSSHTKVRPAPGRVFAVPSGSGDFSLVVYLGLFGHFGHAFGPLHGRYCNRPLSSNSAATSFGRPLSTGLRAITSRRWTHVGDRPEWLDLFPAQPEWFHAKRDFPNDAHVGPHGAAETSTGNTLRQLTACEEATLGLNESTFFQAGLEPEFEAYLRRLHAGAGTA